MPLLLNEKLVFPIAVPLPEAQFTVMTWTMALERLTVKAKAVVPGGVLLVVPSGLTTSSMESMGWVSAFLRVAEVTGLAIVALVAPDRVTVKVSSGSNAVSAHTSTLTGLLVSPGAKVSVPLRSVEHTLELLLLTQLVFRLVLALTVA